jgi:predicted N-acetyltransferase YhbS
MNIRPEQPRDIAAIHDIILVAFETHRYSSHKEHHIVAALRNAGALTVSLVAEVDQQLVGHIACSPVAIDAKAGEWFGLGPVAVLPDRQGQGVGGALVKACIEQLRSRSAAGIVLLGDPGYYGRFGFAPRHELTLPGAPATHFLCLPFGASIPTGKVSYHAAFDAG